MKRFLIKQERDSGFFSDFNLILGNLCYFYINNITDFFILWKNKRYQTDLEINLFEKIFFKNKDIQEFDYVYDPYVLFNWDLLYNFELQHTVLQYYKYFQTPLYMYCAKKAVTVNDALGVHVRRTDHSIHGQLLSNEYYFSQIDKKINKYKYIFLATDCEIAARDFKNKYGDIIFLNDRITRSTNNIPVHNFDAPEKEKLITDVIIDAISLSRCNELLLTQSNVAGYTLANNPSVPYEFVDRHITYA